MPEFVAFLRGINIGNNKRVKMEELRGAFEDMGFEKVRTILASGNVIFETSVRSAASLENKITKALPGIIGFECGIFVIALDSLRALARADPFKEYRMNSRFRLYVTFTRGRQKAESNITAKENGYMNLGKYGEILCSAVDVARGSTTDLMRELDKVWNFNTTRGWNTIERILK